MRGLRLIDKLVVVVNTLAAFLLLLSYGLSFLPPKQFGFLSVLSLGVPVLIVLNLLFVIYWLVKLKKQFLISLVVLILGFNYVTSLYQYSGENNALQTDNFTVMSYNVRLFNLFDWIDENNLEKKILDLVKRERPDILAIQEYHKNEQFNLDGYYKYESLSGDRVQSGQAIYSKYPIIDSGAIEFPNTANNAIFIDVVIHKDTVRVYNLHLQSSKINTSSSSFKQESSENLLNRISRTFQIQQSQSELFLEHQKASPYTTIIAGDFNNTPYSYVYGRIKGNFKDAFEEAGTGFGTTYDFRWFPLRIDFILVDNTFEVEEFKTFNNKYSDHYPVKATLNLHP
jgi:vancomycin resistance protein VanJ